MENNNLFDELYKIYNVNAYTEDRVPDDCERKAISESFYYLLPLIFNEMSDRQRSVINLYYGYNQTQRDIARTLRINQSNVSIHLKQATEVAMRYFNIIYKATLWGLRYGKGEN